MNISVTKDNVIIIEDSNLPHENEYKITKCYFTFDTFTEPFQVKRAIFTILSTGEKFQTDIINNECYVPVDVLKHELETIKIGVYSFDIETIEEDGKEKEVLKQRTSPSYTTFVVPSGSYEEGALSPEIITPTQYDIYSQALQEGLTELEEGLEEVSHVDIDASKSEGVSTVTITNRHNQEKTVDILDGEDGYTPVKGVDYFTTAEIEEIESETKEQVKTDLDFDNTVNRINQDILDLNTNKASKTELENEKTARELADTNLQGQIDAITSSKDVVDIVGTYSDLQNYDTSTLTEEDVIKVLDDSTHNDAMSYYRWSNNIWNYIGSEGPFYTKSETDSLLNTKQATIDSSHKLASDLVDDTNQTNKFTNVNEKNTWNAKYDKPSNGIPKSDLSASVQESLDKADSAIQDVSDKEDKSNKVTEINSSSTDTEYPSAKCVYDSQTVQDNEIDTLKMIYNILPTDTDTGETISIDDTGEMPIKSISLGGNTSQVVIPEEQGTSVSNTSIYVSDVNTDKENNIEMSGNTYQKTTTGANLNIFPYETGGNGNGITFTINNDGTVVLNGTNNGDGNSARLFYNNGNNPMVLEAGRYYIIPPNNTNIVYVMTDGTNYYSFNNNNGYSQLFNYNIGIKQFYVQVAKNNTTTFTNEKIYPMLATTQVTQSDWEEYTGKQLSPNPSYPQDIEVVTGENDIFIQGKNLCPTQENDWEQGSINSTNGSLTSSTTRLRTKNYYLIKNDTNYHISVQDNTNYCFLNIHLYNENKQWIGSMYGLDSVDGQTSKTINISSDDIPNLAYMKIIIRNIVNNATININEIPIIKPQIELGTSATTYEPYVSQTYPINLGNIELCKISTYQDRIYKSNDKWYLEKQIGKVVLNGSESSWDVINAYDRDYFYVNISGILVSNNNANPPLLYSNYYKSYTATDLIVSGVSNYGICRRTNYSQVLFRNIDTTSLANFKTWLNTHNTIVNYPLATPTTTEITDTTLVNQLNALANSTLYSTTNINTTTSNLLPYIDLQYNVITPAPSPSRPSVVNVVKGNNTLTISNSDNTESQTYQVNLPSGLELCEISTYQDYFYKVNGNWYKHSEINKVTLNGTENWDIASDIIFYTTNITDYATSGNTPFSNYFVGVSNKGTASIFKDSGNLKIAFNTSTASPRLFIRYDALTTTSELQTWLSTHNTIVYYVLNTPTNTQITDTTLITQLDNLQKAISYDSQTNISQTNEDKPFIITAEMFLSLKNVLN